jgi:hypothetical protein
MDEPEADYLRQQIRELRRSNTRWKAVALISLTILALLVLAGGGTMLTGRMLMAPRMRMEAERDRAAAMEARMQAEEARMQAERVMQAEREARMRAEEKGAEPTKR